ncbi:hypothetical protein HMPREF9465_00893 [Sutterella wadsworthensis 2_1_59BFAA]|jgi:hypothetical protein|uniref:Helix-turn-helix domain-containing protein n=1 Tax=Sutterella wadsworthensis 2_1_59BFAA TaxID=742823 RepID=K1KIA1_9BURK|nr:helix-turn-helix domain-containing protein [Sutterella wadsworthensis]EKB31494.1 hypothetical protein HMPREF9465_00893 [Sutterella wadsworthensis 2_1_59BFAA]
MSYEAERWAREQTVGNSTAKAVLRELAFCHNRKTGDCFPSLKKIARVLEIKKADTVLSAIRRLEDGGFISRKMVRDDETGQILRTEYTFIGFDATEWSSSKGEEGYPKNQDTPSKNRDTVSQKLECGYPENRVGVSQKTGRGYPENRDVTMNLTKKLTNEAISPREEVHPGEEVCPRKDLYPEPIKSQEKNQEVIGQLQAVEPLDALCEPVAPKPKKSRAKPKTSCPFSSGDAIPPAYLEYARQKHPSIDAQAEFTKFVDFHLSKDNRYCDWYAAWRTWATNAEEYARKRAPSYRPAYGGFREKRQCDRVYDPDDPV